MVLKCDFCKKIIKDNKPVKAAFTYLYSVDLCDKCGKPILNFLKKNKIIKPNKDKELFNP